MDPLTTLIYSLAPSIAISLGKLWLKDKEIGLGVFESVVDLFAEKTGDLLAQRRGGREFEAIGEKVAESLLPLFDEFQIDNAEKEAVALAIADTLTFTPLTTEILAQHDLDPTQLADYLLQTVDIATRDFSDSGTGLYRRNIEEIAVYMVDIASQLPNFTERTLAEILMRERTLITKVEQILAEVREIRAESVAANTDVAAARFEEQYRRTVIRKLDELELFGVDVSSASRRHSLSVAYVTLEVEQRQAVDAAADSQSDADLVHGRNAAENVFAEEHVTIADEDEDEEEIDTTITLSAHAALASAQRLIVQGKAGSGKDNAAEMGGCQVGPARLSS